MRKLAISVLASTLLLGVAAPVSADQNQPSQGIASEGRNPMGFGGGPHCHVIAVESSAQSQFDYIAVYPSHTGHSHAGNDIFLADPDCNGLPGRQ